MDDVETLWLSIKEGLIQDDASRHRKALNAEQQKPRFAGNGLSKTGVEFDDDDRAQSEPKAWLTELCSRGAGLRPGAEQLKSAA